MATRGLWAALFGLALLGGSSEARAQFGNGVGVGRGPFNGVGLGNVSGYGALGGAYSGYNWGGPVGYGYATPYGYAGYPYTGYAWPYYVVPPPRTVNMLGPLGGAIRQNAFPRRDRYRP